METQMLEYINYRLTNGNLTRHERDYYHQLADKLIAYMSSSIFE